MTGYEVSVASCLLLQRKRYLAEATRCKLRLTITEGCRRRQVTQSMRLLGLDLVDGYFNQPASV
jgi:hypothetical protein